MIELIKEYKIQSVIIIIITIGLTVGLFVFVNSFVESDVTIKQIEDDGWSIGHLVSSEQILFARKYSYCLFKSLYFYVLYDSNDRTQLVIEAFE